MKLHIEITVGLSTAIQQRHSSEVMEALNVAFGEALSDLTIDDIYVFEGDCHIQLTTLQNVLTH